MDRMVHRNTIHQTHDGVSSPAERAARLRSGVHERRRTTTDVLMSLMYEHIPHMSANGLRGPPTFAALRPTFAAHVRLPPSVLGLPAFETIGPLPVPLQAWPSH